MQTMMTSRLAVLILGVLVLIGGGGLSAQSVYEGGATFSLSTNPRTAVRAGALKTITQKDVVASSGIEGGALLAMTDGSEFGVIRFSVRGRLAGQGEVELGEGMLVEILGSARFGRTVAPLPQAPSKDTVLGTATLVRQVRVRMSAELQGEAVLDGSLSMKCRAVQAAGSMSVDWVPDSSASLKATGYYDDGVADGASTCSMTMTFRSFGKSTRVPGIVQQPRAVFAEVGKGFSLGVVASGSGPFAYQWFRDGVAVSGATESTYAVTTVGLDSAGAYTVRVGNAYGVTTSSAGVVRVNAAPQIVTSPVGVSVTQGGAFRLSVGAVGSGELRYEWERDGVFISGVAGSVLEVATAVQSDSGSYAVRVLSDYGSVLSPAAPVRVTTGQGVFQAGPEANGHQTVIIPGVQVAFASKETAVGQWKAFVAARPDGLSELWKTPFDGYSQPDTHPVVNVSWNEARRYCEWLSETTGRVWRLPTDAEWLAAAGGGVYPWTLPLSRRSQAGNYDEQNDGYAFTAPGGMFAVNSRGLYDMGGNVWEWVGDPSAGGDSGRRVFRGGSFFIWDPEFMKTSTWASGAPGAAFRDVGFRVVCELSPTILSVSPAGGSLSLAVGSSEDLAVSVSSTLPVVYQWYKDGVLIPGATASVYRVGPAVGRLAGRYTMRARSSGGVAESGAIQVSVTGLQMNGHEVVGVKGVAAAMAKYETTLSQWRNFVASSGWNKSGEWASAMHQGVSMNQTDTHPVVYVSADDAKDYCAWLSEQTGHVWRLPFESEWNIAMGTTRYPWGAQWPPISGYGNMSFTSAGGSAFPGAGIDAVRFTAPVGMFSMTSGGFYDLAGNVSEWVGDENFGGDATLRVIRGSSWMTDSEGEVASMFRFGAPRGARSAAVGFRVVVETLPRIVKQPWNGRSETVNVDVLSVTARTFSGTLSYQWLWDGVAVTGATAETYSVPEGRGGAYQVRVTNEAGTVVSNPVYVAR
jgi:formylglycine-generating enzyme required for sulfatase activity